MLDQYVRARRALNVGFSIVYFCAFSSYYYQYPGLLGEDGVLPARPFLERQSPMTLLRYHSMIGLDFDTAADLFGIVGMILSIFGVAGYGCMPLFAMMWALYFSLFQVGQTFLSFQWDILLLESGALMSLFAPFVPWSRTPPSAVGIVTLRFLFFKLMFMSGVVKLQSEGPTWFNLTALQYHYATQCIPTPLAWYAHQLPGLLHKYSVAATLWLEIPGTFLIIAPTRKLRLIGAVTQIGLQVLIILTGNYNFFNLLTICLACTLVDDTVWSRLTKFGRTSHVAYGQGLTSMIPSSVVPLAHWSSNIITLLGLTACVCSWVAMFETGVSDIQLTMSLADLNRYVDKAVVVVFWYTAACLVFTGFVHLHRTLHMRSILSLPREMVITTAFIYLFGASAVTFTSISKSFKPPSIAHGAMARVYPYHVVSSYGLFRRMTGVGYSADPGHIVVARPEVVLSGSYDAQNWKEIEFLYKPGNVTTPLRQIAPHQPRLDWQMWFAALSSFHHNGWLVHLVYKLMSGSKSVEALLDVERYPFKDKPPRYIRAILYHYDFTSWDRRHTGVWRREEVREYMPILTKDNENVRSFVKQNGWDRVKRVPHHVQRSWLYRAVRALRTRVPTVSVGVVLVALSMLRRAWRHYNWEPAPAADAAMRAKKIN